MKPQQCPLSAIVASWAIYLTGAALLVLIGLFPEAVAWVVGAPLFVSLYVLAFPRLSRRLGYGSVADVAAPFGRPTRVRRVVLYTAAGCPFCPIMRQRVLALSEQLGFGVRVVDLTLNPGATRGKRIRAVPALEIDGRLHVGHLTSREIAELVRGAGAPAPLREPVPA
jgi:glutaredoxin